MVICQIGSIHREQRDVKRILLIHDGNVPPLSLFHNIIRQSDRVTFYVPVFKDYDRVGAFNRCLEQMNEYRAKKLRQIISDTRSSWAAADD